MVGGFGGIKIREKKMYLKDEDLVKFSRTFHMPFSPGITSDDKVHKSLEFFEGKEVIVTEKMDGENTTHTRLKTHARSVDSKGHWSRERMRALQSELSYKLNEPQFLEIHRICGENLVAAHSIQYENLDAYFQCFAIWNRENVCYSWDDTEIFAEELGLVTVPVLAKGIYQDGFILNHNNKIGLINLYTGVSSQGGIQEGFVMRIADSFHYDDYSKCTAKFVRANHVTTDVHWMQSEAIENRVKNAA